MTTVLRRDHTCPRWRRAVAGRLAGRHPVTGGLRIRGESESPGPSDSTPGTGTSTTPGDLPETGVGLTGLILTGFALTIAGAALLFFRRKRDGDDLAGETPAT